MHLHIQKVDKQLCRGQGRSGEKTEDVVVNELVLGEVCLLTVSEAEENIASW
jgi:hypothetical protein